MAAQYTKAPERRLVLPPLTDTAFWGSVLDDGASIVTALFRPGTLTIGSHDDEGTGPKTNPFKSESTPITAAFITDLTPLRTGSPEQLGSVHTSSSSHTASQTANPFMSQSTPITAAFITDLTPLGTGRPEQFGSVRTSFLSHTASQRGHKSKSKSPTSELSSLPTSTEPESSHGRDPPASATSPDGISVLPQQPGFTSSSGGILPQSTSNATPAVTHPPVAASRKPKNNTPIIAGVIAPVVFIALVAAGVLLYRRRQRSRDRREWERTHEAIADAVRQVNDPATLPVGAWNGSRSNLPFQSEKGGWESTEPLFDKSGGHQLGASTGGRAGDSPSYSPSDSV
ncbi:hypothetical protein C8R43DRAFT_1236846 [Mycena crocata]|nr:hypothetical protein C8R43DRAFT_1236846 [Mycena crocata]